MQAAELKLVFTGRVPLPRENLSSALKGFQLTESGAPSLSRIIYLT